MTEGASGGQPSDGARDELTAEEEFFLEQVLKVTGREDRLLRRPWLTKEQTAAFRSILPAIRESTKQGMSLGGRCDLLNRMLLGLGIKPFEHAFFQTVFGEIDFSNEEQVAEQVERFRALCMLEFGSFRFGYKVMKTGFGRHHEKLSEIWSRYFPTPAAIGERVENYKKKPGPIGLTSIPAPRLVALGYLSVEQTEAVNQARRTLIGLLDEGLATSVRDHKGLADLAKTKGINDLGNLLALAGVSDGERLLFPGLHAPGVSYHKILSDARDSCIVLDPDARLASQKAGVLNTLTYLAMHDVDVYVATSMRDPLHFTNNFAFVMSLFKEGELQTWNLRYFDPTQSYVPDRIQKGLTECLMIKRASVAVYNAQESDTFGKDAEAAVALAQGKPVVVYVARLFPGVDKLREVYTIVDGASRVDKAGLVTALRSASFLDDQELTALSQPEKSKIDCVEFAVKKVATSALGHSEAGAVEGELIKHGYAPPRSESGQNLIDFAVAMVTKLERRALLFREVHPLSLQASPRDGVARGVIVTRTVVETARVLRGLLVGGLEYEIVDGDQCWTLVEKTTRSPIRVVSKDPVLTTAFWSEWDDKSEDDYLR